MSEFYIFQDKQKKGPFNLDQLKSMSLDKATPIWHGDIKAWTTAESIEALATKSPTGPEIKIIIADDHVLFRAGIKNALSVKKDIKVIAEAENGSHLLNLLKGVQPDVILLDIQMPVMDGMTALPEIKKIYPGIKVIMVTMMDDQSMIKKLMQLGANSYLTKMSDSDVIYSTIKTCHERGFCFNSFTDKALQNNNYPNTTAPVHLPSQDDSRGYRQLVPPTRPLQESRINTTTTTVASEAGGIKAYPAPRFPLPAPKINTPDTEMRDRILNSFSDAPELVGEKSRNRIEIAIVISIVIAGIIVAYFSMM